MATLRPPDWDSPGLSYDDIVKLDPRNCIVYNYGVPNDLTNLFRGFERMRDANREPSHTADSDTGTVNMEVETLPTGIYHSYGPGSKDGKFHERGRLFRSIDIGGRERNTHEIGVDWLLSTIGWNDTDFRDFYGIRRLTVAQSILEKGEQAYARDLQATGGNCPNQQVPYGVTVTVGENTWDYRFLLDIQLARGYDTTVQTISRTIAYYATPRGQDTGPVASETTDIDTVRRAACEDITPAATKKTLSGLTAYAGEQLARVCPLPTQLSAGAQPFEYPHKDQVLEQLEGLIMDEDNSPNEGMTDLLRVIINRLPTNIPTPEGYLPPKSLNTVKFSDYPATESRPGIDETGINDYDRGQDTRRYGFDMGFMSKLLKDTFTIEKSSTRKLPSFMSFLRKVSDRTSKKLLFQHEATLKKRHYQLYSLAHRLDRIEKAGKYIEAWVTAVGIDPTADREQYADLRSVIPQSWLKDAEREVLAKRNPTQCRDTFKKEVAAKLMTNYQFLQESEAAHLVSLGAQVQILLSKLIRGYFTAIIEEINSQPDNVKMTLDYYNDAKEIVDRFLLTDNQHDILFLPGATEDRDPCMDVLATRTSTKLMNKLRDMVAQANLTAGTAMNMAFDMDKRLRLLHEEIPMGTLRFSPAGEQPWLVTLEGIEPTKVTHDTVKMRKDSVLTERVWALIQLTYISFSDKLAALQESYNAHWEKAYLEKALKEDERRKAQHIFSEVKVQLGSSETICTYHRLYDGNDHKNIHCKYAPCYLHTWKCYEISDQDEGCLTVTKAPNSKVHLNGNVRSKENTLLK
eukprot:TRINITY_DN11355_c0_g1_i1.p1 TRINITY_DN11355_c0_g1~~TRINITY_DN11355_c0_g1_i1.p1  ORF type:complete len:800 (-),score=74.36 TRINITY_DN11355_c0_g1_i1:120-2519(-)